MFQNSQGLMVQYPDGIWRNTSVSDFQKAFSPFVDLNTVYINARTISHSGLHFKIIPKGTIITVSGDTIEVEDFTTTATNTKETLYLHTRQYMKLSFQKSLSPMTFRNFITNKFPKGETEYLAYGSDHDYSHTIIIYRLTQDIALLDLTAPETKRHLVDVISKFIDTTVAQDIKNNNVKLDLPFDHNVKEIQYLEDLFIALSQPEAEIFKNYCTAEILLREVLFKNVHARPIFEKFLAAVFSFNCNAAFRLLSLLVLYAAVDANSFKEGRVRENILKILVEDSPDSVRYFIEDSSKPLTLKDVQRIIEKKNSDLFPKELSSAETNPEDEPNEEPKEASVGGYTNFTSGLVKIEDDTLEYNLNVLLFHVMTLANEKYQSEKGWHSLKSRSPFIIPSLDQDYKLVTLPCSGYIYGNNPQIMGNTCTSVSLNLEQMTGLSLFEPGDGKVLYLGKFRFRKILYNISVKPFLKRVMGEKEEEEEINNGLKRKNEGGEESQGKKLKISTRCFVCGKVSPPLFDSLKKVALCNVECQTELYLKQLKM